MTFNKWIDTFLEEKEIDLDETFEVTVNGTYHLMPYKVVVDTLKNYSLPEEKKRVKMILVKEDFVNADIRKVLQKLAIKMLEVSRVPDAAWTK